MISELKSIFHSDLVHIYDFKCVEEPHSKSDLEEFDSYEISILKQGYFFLDITNTHYEIYTEYMMLGNKGMEYKVTHGNSVYDECTVIRVDRELIEEIKNFYWKKDFSAPELPLKKDDIIFPLAVLKTNAGFDCSHRALLDSLNKEPYRRALLKVELLAIGLLEDIFREIYSMEYIPGNLKQFKRIHLDTIERAKCFINENFQKDISLSEIASSSFLTPFHFTRIFKKYTGLSPYSYLIQFRLKYAAMLLLNTKLTETEICFQSGFNSFSHFITTFTKHFSSSPYKFRHSRNNYSFRF